MTTRYTAIVIGLSAGGMEVLKLFTPQLPKNFPLPIVIAQHISEDSDGFLAEYLDEICALTVKEAEDKEPLRPGHIYLAPGGYHLLIENDHSFSLSADPRVNYSCPSIDVLFDSAADAFGPSLIGAIMTGANSDGSKGLAHIKKRGGLAIIQNPKTARASAMPQAALATTPPDHITELVNFADLLIRLSQQQGEEHELAASR